LTLESALEDLRSADTFKEAMGHVEHSVAGGVEKYRCRLPAGTPEPATKAIKDAVWGMISLDRREVSVLDSPPLQRLRRIRQLGLGYLTYPTAGYSRFEHTLGAVHQADTMVRAVASRTGRVVESGPGTSTYVGEPEILALLPVVRLAALLHDVGHLPLSHVSERYYSRAECSNDALIHSALELREDVAQALDVPRPSLAECLSLAMILSPTFFALLTGEAMYTRADVQAASAAIVGRAPSTRNAFVYQLITNVVDADKLDYMFRDGFLTGVPLAVDLERLLYKLKCIELPVEYFPEALVAIQEDDSPALVLGIDLAGQRLAYDVTVARTMLFERVYLHHKTRAAERVAMRRLDSFNMPPWWLLAFDDSLFVGDQPMSPTVQMLRSRSLPRRVYALSHGLLPGASVGEAAGEPQLPPEQADSWRRLVHDLERAPARLRLEAKIHLTAQRFAQALKNIATVESVWVDTVPGRGDLGTWDLWVETPDGEIGVADTYGARAAAFAHSPSQTFYVYASGDGRVSEVGYLAAEYVMATRYGLFTGRRSADGAKVPYRSTDALKRTLEQSLPDLYARVGRLRPEPSFLRKHDTHERLASLAERFYHYHGQPKVRVDTGRIRDFLRQFPESLVEPMLSVLEAIQFLDRDDLGASFADYLEQEADPAESYVPLTLPADKSASHLPYFLADRRETRLKVMHLSDALDAAGPITFFDDCNISATQSRTAVQVWLGMPPDLESEADEIAQPLTAAQVEELESRRVRFRFAYAHGGGVANLAALTSAANLGADIGAMRLEERAKPLTDEEPPASLIDFLRDVGGDILASTKGVDKPEAWPAARCLDCALGYGDSQQLVIMVYNSPTGTVTPIWKAGRFRGAPWMPLFPRRDEPGVVRPPE
jgi:HD superfamily phosphohydrolase